MDIENSMKPFCWFEDDDIKNPFILFMFSSY